MTQLRFAPEAGVTVRPLRTQDLDEVAAMFERVSDLTVYRRFFSPRAVGTRWELDYLARVDGADRYVLVAESDARIVGMARYHRTESSRAEVAVLVDDEWQHHGLGRRLMLELGRAALRAGISAFDVSVLGDNLAALGLIRRMSTRAALRLEHGVFVTSVPLAG